MFQGEQRTLRIKQIEVAGDTILVAQVRQAQPLSLGRGLGLLGARLLGQQALTGQGIGHLPEGALDRFFVLGDRDRAARLRGIQCSLVAPGIEHGKQCRHRRRERPASALEQIRQLCTGRACLRGECDAGEEGRARCADAGIGRDQLLLGLPDVWPLGQQVRRQARRQVGHGGHGGQAAASEAGTNVVGQRLPQQQSQGVFVQGALPLLLRQRGTRSFGQRLGLAVVQVGGQTDFPAHLGQRQGVIACGQRAPRDVEQFFVCLQREPAICHPGDEADLHGLAPLFAGEVLRKGLLLETAQAAEKVQLPSRQDPSNAVGIGERACAGTGRSGSRGAHAHRWPLRSPLNLELRARLLNGQCGHAQVAVVGQGGFNQPLQARVGEVVLPIRAGGSGAGRATLGVGRRHRGFRAFIGRNKGAATQQEDCQGDRGNDGFIHGRKSPLLRHDAGSVPAGVCCP